MMTLIRRGPAEFPSASRLFSHLLNDPSWSGAEVAQLDEGTLPLDISEDEENVIVRATVPGFSREEIDVQVHNGVLTLKAERRREREEKTERYYRRELRFGSMSRRVALPSTVEESKTQAELKDGVLTLHIPKSEQAMPRKVQIK